MCEPCEDLSAVVDAINAFPQATVKALLPAMDAQATTDDGAVAVVRRDFWEQTHDQSVNEQSTYDQQVPALRLVAQEDAYAHSALIVDLAAPQAEAHRDVRPCFDCGPIALASGAGLASLGRFGIFAALTCRIGLPIQSSR